MIPAVKTKDLTQFGCKRSCVQLRTFVCIVMMTDAFTGFYFPFLPRKPKIHQFCSLSRQCRVS